MILQPSGKFMPLFRAATKVIYFAHVPKAAGTTIEHYLKARFGALALYYPAFGKLEPSDRWSHTSPQHMPETARQRYLPDAFVDAFFTTVRHPATRLHSAFLFQRDIEGNIPADMPFQNWLNSLDRQMTDTNLLFDGHIRPMVDFVPPSAKVFRLEDGLSAVVDWLDQQVGATAPNVTMVARNVLIDRLRFEKRPLPTGTITPQAFNQIATLYQADYAQFGYDLHPPKPT